jgi:hypothetical protein
MPSGRRLAKGAPAAACRRGAHAPRTTSLRRWWVYLKPIRILLQTTIPTIEDDWSIARFSLLAGHLASLTDAQGQRLCDVVARDRCAAPGTDDPVLATLAASDVDQLWLFAVDTGDGLTANECAAIDAFRRPGGGLLVTRDHMDLGSSVCTLGGIGAAHYFHSQNPDPDPGRRCIDDPYSAGILWPNYHSGANGDFQAITAVDPKHPLLRDERMSDGTVRFFPAHPHEGGIGVPIWEESARVIAMGRSKTTGRPFNLVVAFEGGEDLQGNRVGRGVAQSTFHHFCDYNWDLAYGCPSFVDEPPGDGMRAHPEARHAIETYIRNLAVWLSGERQ